ncbi:NUDIX domain-containing protein [Limnobacter humi]|uniref:NUDIX domain-containing protein n=1 Tax=Limnobacter humi TaxID=1778671 RepID=A0ABT1WD08_9BURK|nr:NUDIX domain-containing protein [Limnobacter humi]MCQ8895408.1 NUDIX domain-containing protein [Limnobacter humi]
MDVTRDWALNTLAPAFAPFAKRWRDADSPEQSHFIPVRITRPGSPGEPAQGWIHRDLLNTIETALARLELSFRREASALHLEVRGDKKPPNDLQTLAEHLRALGLLKGWRGETQAVQASRENTLMHVERALFKALGLCSEAVHVHVETHDGLVWLGVRADHKAENPGMLDNLCAGGVCNGETPQATLWRELQEETGLSAQDFEHMAWVYNPNTPLRMNRPLLHGGWHQEWVHVVHAVLKPGVWPRNQDGEVKAFNLLSRLACTQQVNDGRLTPDAGLCTALVLSKQ